MNKQLLKTDDIYVSESLLEFPSTRGGAVTVG